MTMLSTVLPRESRRENNGKTDSGVPVPGANSSEDISSAFVHLRNDDDKIPGDVK